MKISKISSFIFLMLLFISCNKEDLNRKNFIQIKTGTIASSSVEMISLESEILGFESGKIIEHGYVYSCISEMPEIGDQETDTKLLGIRLEGGTFSGTIENLEPNTTYYIRAFTLIENEQEANYGETIIHRSSNFDLTISTDDVEFIPKGFEMFGTISNLDSEVVIEKYGFVWSTEKEEPEVELDNSIYLGTINESVSFSKRLENVTALENYHVRAFAQIGKDIFYGEIISFFKGDIWIEKEEIVDSRDGLYFAEVNDIAYFGGGYRAGASFDLQAYDPVTDTWSYKTPIDVFVNHGTAFSIEETLYVVSGNSGIEDKLLAYNTINNTWSQKANFPASQRSFTTAISHQGKGYLCLGRSTPDTGEIWEYDPNSDSWSLLTNFPGGHREEAIVFTYESKLYIGFGTFSNDLYAFDFNTLEWEEKSALPLDFFSAVNFASFQIADKAYLYTGTAEGNFWEYDIPSDTWKLKSDFSGNPFGGHPGYVTINDRGYMTMGFDRTTNTYNWKMWEYIPDAR